MPTCILYTVSVMDVVDLLLWNTGNDMDCAKCLSMYALVPSDERLQNVRKEVEQENFCRPCNVAHV